MDIDYATLKARQRELRHAFPESLGLRVHRALSWLHRAEQEPDDHDARFINRLIDADRENMLYELVWKRYPTSIHLLMDNRFVYQPFWDHVNGYISEAEWQERCDRSRASARPGKAASTATRSATAPTSSATWCRSLST